MVVALGTVEPHARPPLLVAGGYCFSHPNCHPTGCGSQRAELLHALSLKCAPRCVCDRRAGREAESVQSGLGRAVGSFWLVFWVDGTRLSDGLRGNRQSRATLLRLGLRANTPRGRVVRYRLWPQAWERSPGSYGAETVTASKVAGGLGYLGSPCFPSPRKDPTEGQSNLNNLQL